MKQTAVEWFEDQVGHNSLMALKEFNEIFEKAKEMEKEQIIDSYRDGRSDQQSDRPSKFYNRMAEQYYKETFKQQEQ
jgi:HEPN domain-containing protein